MNHPLDWLGPFLDEELEAAQTAELERHLAGCAECATAVARLRELKRRIHTDAPYYPAPAELQRSVRDALRREAAPVGTPLGRAAAWRWMAIAASLLLAVSVGWNVIAWRSRTASNSLAADVLTGHIRSLIGEHLLDVPSSDQHTVKPWFAGKLDFSPEVKDLAADGFPLVGGRIDYLAGRRVAALVFHRRQHVINLFTWPDPSAPGGAARFTRDGYHLLHWNDGAMAYWAVSDAGAAELARLLELYVR